MQVTFAILLAWIVALPVRTDLHGYAIPRPANFSATIAKVALEYPDVDPYKLAATLDVLAAHEGSYSTHPRGLNDHGASKGAWQTPSNETPDDGLGQARVAVKWILVSWKLCPAFPLSRYATGRYCGKLEVSDRYWREVQASVSAPLPSIDETLAAN